MAEANDKAKRKRGPGIGTYVIQDPLFDAEHDDEELLIMHLPVGSRLERAMIHISQILGLEFYQLTRKDK